MADIERIRAVIAQMSLEEKTALTQIDGGRVTRALPALKVPSLELPPDFSPLALSSVPYTAIGAAFDTELSAELGRLRAVSAARTGAALAGTVSVGVTRSPMSESDSFGEDPVAVSRQVRAYASSAPLPYAADEIFTEGLDRWIDPRALYEIYLKPYLDNKDILGGAVLPGGAVNGAMCCEKPFVSAFEKGKPLFVRGYDAPDAVDALNGGAGLYLGASAKDAAAMYASIRDGKTFEKKLDAVLEPLLSLCYDYNEFKKNTLATLGSGDAGPAMERLYEESAVLLKNDGILPAASFAAISNLPTEDALCGDFTPRFIRKAAKLAADRIAVLVVFYAEALPEGTAALVEAVAAAARGVVVVLAGTHAVPLPFADKANALLFAPLYDETAVGKLLRGETAPSGRLPFTWCAKESDYPSSVKRGNREMYAAESVYVGYRYFDAFGEKVLFPFGHGLGYAALRYELGKLSLREDGLHVPFSACNSSERAVSDAALLFAQLSVDGVYGVERRLAAFKRVFVPANGKTEGEIVIDTRDLYVYDPAAGGSVLPGGKYRISLQGAVTEVKLGKKYKMKGFTREDVPSYYPADGPFKPLGVDTEKILRAKAFTGKSEIDRYLVRAESCPVFLYVRLYKKYRVPKRLREQFRKRLDRLSVFSLEKAAALQ